jgi:hypothetical protein
LQRGRRALSGGRLLFFTGAKRQAQAECLVTAARPFAKRLTNVPPWKACRRRTRILVKLVNINNRRLQFAKDLHIAAVDQLGAKRGQSDGLRWGMENRTSCTSGKNGPASDALMDREHQERPSCLRS